MRKLFSTLLLSVLVVSAMAQPVPPALPIDANVRYGVLDNGLTYYIRHNENPKNQAEFYIAQKVGSIVEEEDQRGLAHFLEHMAFNGTKNYPDKALLNYLESIGMKFGANINAYTSIDETVYNLSAVPVVREGIVDSCLLVLADWASGIALENDQIDKERGVIIEEWRTTQSAYMRNYEKLLPVIYGKGNRYANRLPIGLPDVIANFSYQTLKDYYHKWYRPDLQGIMVVGDIDVDYVEAKIKQMFGSTPLDANRAERVWFQVDNNTEPIVAVAADKEQPATNLYIFFKHDKLPAEVKKSVVGLASSYIGSMISSMFAERVAEITQKPNSPFLKASLYDDDFFIAKTKGALSLFSTIKEDGIDQALTALTAEIEKIDRYGFTPSEYERAKAKYLTAVENKYNERAKTKNEEYVEEYVDHFVNGGSIAGIEKEYELLNQIIPTLSVDVVNQYVQSVISDDNVVITLMMPEKDGVAVPTAEYLKGVFEAARKAEVAAYVDEVSDKPLINQMPKPGKVKSVKYNEKVGAEEWTLSNGVKVFVKSTDFKGDQIIMQANSKGGYSLFGEADALHSQVFDEVVAVGGVGDFSATELKKALAGKRVGVAAGLSEFAESIGGSSSIKDLETMLQLTYLMFTAPRQDQEAFESWKQRTKIALQSQAADPMLTLGDSLVSVMYNNSPFRKNPKPEDIDKIDYDRVMELYNQRFGNAGDFTFTFVGNIDNVALKTLLEKYIASLPTSKTRENYRDLGLVAPKGKITNHFAKQMEVPKSSVYMIASGLCDYNLENSVKMSLLQQILTSVYTETLREEEGGTYGAYVSGRINQAMNRFVFYIVFDTNADQRDALLKIVYRELDKIQTEGPSPETLAKMREYMLKKHKENATENPYWVSVINNKIVYGVDVNNDYEKVVNEQTVDSIRDFAKKIFGQNNMIELVMNGEK